MKKALLALLLCVLSLSAFVGMSWAQCPEDASDRGECDTLNVVCLDGEQTPGTGPWSVRFPLLITHDQTETSDSIAGFAIPLVYTHSNPAAYCSVTSYWNGTLYYSIVPDFARSIFRHMFETDYPTPSADTLYRNRMAAVEGMFTNKGWDLVILEFGDGTDRFWLTMVPTGSADQRWWEGDRTLLATMTMRVQDTTEVCIDSTFWPPATSLTFARSDAETYVPRHNLPQCFRVGPPLPPDFAIDAAPDTQVVVAGDSADYDVTLTSLNGFSSSVDLSVSGLPTNATGSFDPDPVVPTATSVMRVKTGAATPAGTYDLTITGTEVVAKLQHTIQVVLKVTIPEAIALTAPNGGEEWCVGSGQNITWSSSGIDSVRIEYTTGNGWTEVVGSTPAGPGTYSWTIPDVPSDNCLVRIHDAADGTPTDESDAAFTISDIPTAPTGCIASDDLCDSVEVSWTDNSNNELKFYIYRDAALLDSVGAGVTIYRDATGTPGTTYEYCVSAYNTCGESAQSCDNGTRKAVPDTPTDCAASEGLCDMVQFFWQDNAGDEIGFYIYRGGTKIDSVGSDVSSYIDYGASPGTTYEYCVSVYNECGESGQCCDEGARLAPPSSPTGCLASDDLCDKVRLSWTDNSGNELGFIIYRGGSALDTVGADVTSYDDLTGAPGVTYEYCVSAYNDCGESVQCCEDGTRPAPPDGPTDCAATDDLCGEVQLSWTDNSDDEIGFYVYRDAAKIDSAGADVESYDDLTASPGTGYEYCVSSYNECGESGQSCDNGTRKATPAAPSDCAASDDLCDSVHFCWTDNSNDETKFYVYRDAALLDSVGADVTCYDDLSGTPGVTYNYCVTAYNECGESSPCCDDGLVVPEAVTVTSPDGGESWTVGTSQDITWSSDCLDSVNIEYSTNSGSNWTTQAQGVLAGLGSYSWTVPDAPSENCLVRVCDAEDGSPCDQSNAVFTISSEVVEAITVTSPNGGEVWCVGSSRNITWTYSDMDTLKIEYSTNSGSAWTTEAEKVPAAAGSYSWTIPDAPSVNCLVRICDARDGDPCDQSNAVFAIEDVPTDPTGCMASDGLCDKVVFCWADISDNESGFYVYREGVKIDSLGAGFTCYDDLAAAPGVTYQYCVTAYNQCGQSGQCCDHGIRLAPPSAPTNCGASDDSCDVVAVWWQDNSDDETGFYVYRDAAKLDSVGSDVTVYTDYSAGPGVTYTYCVSAYATCGESNQCCDEGTRLAPPADPTGCLASDGLCDKVVFCWADVSDDEMGFYIYRDGAKIDSLGAGATCYDDLAAAPGVTYEYCVTAYNECGESGRCCNDGSIPEESIMVISPDGGENWGVGESRSIQWDCLCTDSVKLEYSTDAGANWIFIQSGIPCAAGSHAWTIPDTPSDECLVRVSDASDSDPSDVSDDLFTIGQGAPCRVDPTSLDFGSFVVPDSSDLTFTITNTGGGTLTGVVTETCLDYRVLGDPAYSLTDGQSKTFTVRFRPLVAGVKTCTIETGSGACDDVGCTGTGESPATCLVYPESLDFGALPLGDSAELSFTVWNPCAGNLVGTVSENCEDFALIGDVTYCLMGGQSKVFRVRFKPTSAGAKECVIETGHCVCHDLVCTGMGEDFNLSADPGVQDVTAGQPVAYLVELTSLSGFDVPCTLLVSGLPDGSVTAVFDQPTVVPSAATTLNVYTTAQTDPGQFDLTITARSMPGGKSPVVEHGITVVLRIEECTDAGDWTDDGSNSPDGFALFQNRPNPFNPETEVSFRVPQRAQVTVTIYNVTGKKVTTLVAREMEAGIHTVRWSGTDENGNPVASGIYFYRLQSGMFDQTKRMILMK